MALMPPRRSARLSGNEHSGSSTSSKETTSAKAYAPIAGPSRSIKSSYDSAASATSSWPKYDVHSKATSSSSTDRRERRFEDISSDDEGEAERDCHFMAGFERPVISGNARHAASIPLPRAPRATFHEEAGDDGFIFSKAAQHTSSTVAQGKRKSLAGIAGSRGAPPRGSSAHHARLPSSGKDDEGNDRGLRPHGGGSIRTPPPPATIQERRLSSSAVKAVRRVSNLRDGSAAHPHPIIADGDLHRHCSTDLDKADRLRHMANWTLSRSTKKLISRFTGPIEARTVLERTLHTTLQSLSNGDLKLTWPGMQERASASQHKRPHPRNEANRRTERALRETVQLMQDEVNRWERCKDELHKYQVGTEKMEREQASSVHHEAERRVDLHQILEREQDDSDLRRLIGQALLLEAPWLGVASDGNTLASDVVALAKDMYSAAYDQEVPQARSAKRRRTTTSLQEGDEGKCAEPLQGTEADTRWHDVEWNVDLLQSRTHRIGQLVRLADRYTAAISSRGAQAIDEMINGPSKNPDATADSTSSLVSQESQRTLQRILASVRTVEAGVGGEEMLTTGREGRSTQSAVAAASVPGELSEGDILRAFAGLSGRSR